MKDGPICPECGQELDASSLDGLCPKCLSRLALADELEEDREISRDAEARTNVVTQGGKRFGDYELIEELGRGGMGVVYKARQVSLDRVVALKVVLGGHFASREARRRFRLEAEAAARLRHPGIVAVYEVGELDGHPYYSMEYVAGRPLTELVRERPLPARASARYLEAVAKAINYAHESGIVHRDLKPSNILVDEFDCPRITDFGLARQLGRESDLTVTGQMLGSPNYMSPEQAMGNGAGCSPTTDVYAMGALMYHLITGRPPFLAATVQGTLLETIHAQPVAPRLLNPDVPRDLETICLRCLEKQPEKRYHTAAAVAAELDRFLRDVPILARPIHPVEQLWRWCRRRPREAGLGAAVVLLLSISAVVAVVAAYRIQKEESRTVAMAASEAWQRRRAEEALTLLEIQRAEAWFESDDAPTAMAYLARLLRRNPNNTVVAERLLSAMSLRDFPIPVARPLSHDGPVRSVSFSGDGRLVATGSDDHSARLWDLSSGEAVSPPLRHNDAVRAVAFSRDNATLVTASSDHTVRVWDAKTGSSVIPPLQHGGAVSWAEYSPNGDRLLTLSDDGLARIWDSARWELVCPPLKHPSAPSCGSFDPSGRWVATGCSDGGVRIWDSLTGQALSKRLDHTKWVRSIAFSSDGRLLATASDDKTALIWEWASDGASPLTLRHDQAVLTASFHPHGEIVLTSGEDDCARLWELHTGRPVLQPLAHRSDVFACFSPSGRQILTYSWDMTARVWDASTEKPAKERLRHSSGVIDARFRFDEHFLVTGSYDHTAQIWDLRPGRLQPLRLRGKEGVQFATFSPDGKRVLTADGDGAGRLWNLQTGHASRPSFRHPGGLQWADFSPDGKQVVTASSDGTARVWDVESGAPQTDPLAHKAPVILAKFDAKGARLLTIANGGMAQVWDARRGVTVGPVLNHPPPVSSADLSPDGEMVLVSTVHDGARLWEAGTGRLLGHYQPSNSVRSVRFSANGRRVLTSCADYTARVWDIASGREAVPALWHDQVVLIAQFSPNGQWIATGSEDNTARIWDAATGRPVTEPLRHTGWVDVVEFSPDSRRLITGTRDAVLRVWDVPSGSAVSEPMRHPARVRWARVSPDGTHVVTVSGDSSAYVWELPRSQEPIPGWLPELGEALARLRLDDDRSFRAVPATALAELRDRLASTAGSDDYGRWIGWFFEDRGTRAISPASSVVAVP